MRGDVMDRNGGRLLVGLGIVHIVVGIAAAPGPLADIARSGFYDAVDPHLDRQVVFWFHLGGVLMMLLGGLAQWAQARTGAVPVFLGAGLLGTALAGVLLMPISGFWLVVPIAVLLLRAARHGVTPRGEERAVGSPSS